MARRYAVAEKTMNQPRWRKLTKKNAKEAKEDLRKLSDPGYGGYNLLYGDGYYAMSLESKWGDLQELDAKLKAMDSESASMEGAGI